MKRPFLSFWRAVRRAVPRLIGASLLATGVAWAAPVTHLGPVPTPTDLYGAAGPYNVVQETFPSPAWPEEVVTVFRPEGAEGRRPVWFFAHGFGGTNAEFYRELLTHLASHGDVVVFSPYPVALPRESGRLYETLWAGFAAAADRYADRIDTTRVGFAGHSYGAGAVPWVALKGLRERGWGGQALALFIMAPWYSYFTSDADLAAFPAHTQAVVQVYEDDLINDHRMAIDLFLRLNVAAENKDYLMIHSDRIDGYNYVASHRVPTGYDRADSGFTPSTFDALDTWGVARIATALGASAFGGDAAARAVALGHGSMAQTQMGAAPGGRALRPMTQTAAPVALFPETRYRFPFHDRLNPRADAALPSGAGRSRLMNLSARARSADGEEVLIAGAVVAGARPKTLLVRAVGPGLTPWRVTGAMPDPQLLIHRGGTLDLSLDNWGDGPSPSVTAWAAAETGAFPLADGSRDAALTAAFNPQGWSIHAPPADGRSGVALLELYDADADTTSWLSNLSARARVGGGDDLLIAGFVTTGTQNLRLLIRGIGPALTPLGVGSALPDPILTLYRGNQVIASNDNWSADPVTADAIAAAAAQVGAFALSTGSADASLLVSLPPGVYSAQVAARDGRTGVGLVEVYLVP